MHICFFCFKQETAYEMRISDWSSYVFSSDLDHLSGPNDENWFDVTAEFNATDSTGDEVPGDFQVKVVDDVPDAVDNTASVSEVVGDPQNVTLVVDVSASISGSAFNDMTAGLKALVAQYAALGLPITVTDRKSTRLNSSH